MIDHNGRAALRPHLAIPAERSHSSEPGGEAVPALRPAGILPAAGNKGKMPSPRGAFQLTPYGVTTNAEWQHHPDFVYRRVAATE